MALHSALTRLREGGTLGNKLENDSLTPKLQSTRDSVKHKSMFMVDEADLFDFDDDDIFKDIDVSTPPSVEISTSPPLTKLPEFTQPTSVCAALNSHCRSLSDKLLLQSRQSQNSSQYTSSTHIKSAVIRETHPDDCSLETIVDLNGSTEPAVSRQGSQQIESDFRNITSSSIVSSTAKKLSSFEFVRSTRKRTSIDDHKVVPSKKRLVDDVTPHLQNKSWVTKEDICTKMSSQSDGNNMMKDVISAQKNSTVKSTSWKTTPSVVSSVTLPIKETMPTNVDVPGCGTRQRSPFILQSLTSVPSSSLGSPFRTSKADIISSSTIASPQFTATSFRTPTSSQFNASSAQRGVSSIATTPQGPITAGSTSYNSIMINLTQQRGVSATPQCPIITGIVSTQRGVSATPQGHITTGTVSNHTQSTMTTPTQQRGVSSNTIGHSTPIKRRSNLMNCTPLNRRVTSMVSTPIDTSHSGAMEIMRTPVLLAQRKFPGPAGLLPPLVVGQNMENVHILPPSTPVPASTPQASRLPRVPLGPLADGEGGCGDAVDFTTGPWVEMLNDLDLNDSYSSALLNYSISRSVKQSSMKQLCNGKVVHLRAILKSILPAGNNASAVLKDPTGEIMCTIHSQVLEEYRKELQPGAVFVLRQVSMFSPGPRRHYLNITPPNVVKVYPPRGSCGDRRSLTQLLFEVEKRYQEENGNKTTPISRPPAPPSTPVLLHLQGNTRPLFMTAKNSVHQNKQTFPGMSLPVRCKQRSITGTSAGARLIFGKGSTQSRPVDGLAVQRDIEQSVVVESNNGIPGGVDCENKNKSVPVKVTDSSFFSNLCEDEFDDLFAEMNDV